MQINVTVIASYWIMLLYLICGFKRNCGFENIMRTEKLLVWLFDCLFEFTAVKQLACC